MKKIITLVLLSSPVMGLMAQQDCSHALAAQPNTTYDVSYAENSQVPGIVCTQGTTNPDILNHGAWYTYTPDALYSATISTEAALQDTRMHIYKGTCNELICVAGDDDSGENYSSIATFMAEAGVTYYIAFDDNWTEDDFSFIITQETFIAPLFTPHYVQDLNDYTKCVVDMNGDYLDDIVSPADGHVTILYQSANNSGFTTVNLTAPQTQFMPGWSMAAGDFDKNGYNDLLYGENGGAAIMLQNANGTAFSQKLESTDYIFSQRTNFVDVNADGNLDAFVCHDIGPNVYFKNDGEGGFEFMQGGVGDYPSGGNYGSIWIDFDNDGDMDLFIAKCRGGSDEAALDELHRNNGDGTFTNIAQQVGFANLHQSWSAAWADYDNDGDMDVMIGSSAGAYGEFDPNNPLHAHKLYRNDGNAIFTEVTAGSGFDTFTIPSLEHVAHDFNNDGFIDVLAGGNRIMYNNGNMTFTPVETPAGSGPVGDLNNDGFLDIQNGNIVFFNYGNSNNWIKVNLQGIESNRNGIGARVEVYTTTAGIEKQIREIRSGDGFSNMSSLNAYFGLGTAETIQKVVVKWPSGTTDTLMNPDVNASLLVVEGEHVLGNEEFASTTFSLYPNPATDYLHISGNEAYGFTTAAIYDLSGRLVKTAKISDGSINIQSLAKGTYVVTLKNKDGKEFSKKVIKK
jgi:hypothetical protein